MTVVIRATCSDCGEDLVLDRAGVLVVKVASTRFVTFGCAFCGEPQVLQPSRPVLAWNLRSVGVRQVEVFESACAPLSSRVEPGSKGAGVRSGEPPPPRSSSPP